MQKSILTLLLQAGDYLSGEEIASSLCISRTAVWKHISALKEQGFEIDSQPRKGYRITRVPDERIIPEVVQARLGRPLPFPLHTMSSTGSTNTEAKKMVLNGYTGTFLLSADEQTAGRGRLQRVWQSRPGQDLLLTFNLAVDGPVNDFFHYTILTAVSVHATLCHFLGSYQNDLKIKWPNDVYYGHKKLCGILSEMISEEYRIRNMLIGIGINVNSLPVMERAATMHSVSGQIFDRHAVLAFLIDEMTANLALYIRGGFDDLFISWKNHLGWLGTEIRLDTGRGVISGTLVDIARDGAVTIRQGGEDRVYYTGDLLLPGEQEIKE